MAEGAKKPGSAAWRAGIVHILAGKGEAVSFTPTLWRQLANAGHTPEEAAAWLVGGAHPTPGPRLERRRGPGGAILQDPRGKVR